MGISTFRASEQGRAKIRQAREMRGWMVREEDTTPLKEASKFLIQQHATANEWSSHDSRWLKEFERLVRVENHKTIQEIKTLIIQSKKGSFLEQIEQLIDVGEVFVKDISYGSWNRFASLQKSYNIKARAFKAYCHILGLNWQEIVEQSNLQELKQTPVIPTSVNHTLPTGVYHNLPVRYHTALIGRQTEVSRLLKLLSHESPTSHISVEGMGGAGKTSLVLEAAYHCLQISREEKPIPLVPRFNAIIFASAKQQHLIGNHILQRHRRERTLNDIFRAILATLQAPSGSMSANFDQQLELIQRRLQVLQTLLIVDNLETIEDQESVLSFLYDLPPSVKVVITTRVRGAFGVCIYLAGLPLDQAMRLMEHQAQEQSVQLNPEHFQEIYHRTSGLPLGIVYAIGQLSVYGVSSQSLVTRLTQANSDLALYCFEDSVQRLRGQLAHRLLMAMALFTKSALPDAIAQVALTIDDSTYQVNSQSSDFLNTLAQLYKLRLVIQRGERYDMHPLTREYAIAELNAHSEFEQQARERWVNWYLKFSQPYGQQDWREWQEYQDLEQEWENLQVVINWCIDHNHYEQVKLFWQHVKGYTYVHGYWHERLNWIDWLLQSAQQRQDESMMVEALIDKGWTLTPMGKPEQLAQLDALFAQVSHRQNSEESLLHLELTIERAVLSIHQRKFTQAHQLLNQGKVLLKQVQLEDQKRQHQQLRLDYYEAEVWFETGHYAQAKMLYQRALEQARIVQWQLVEVYILNWLAEVALMGEGNLDEAERLLNTSMPIAMARKDKRSIAFHQRSWAHLENKRGNLAEFQRWAIEAREGFETLGMLTEAQEMQGLLDG